MNESVSTGTFHLGASQNVNVICRSRSTTEEEEQFGSMTELLKTVSAGVLMIIIIIRGTIIIMVDNNDGSEDSNYGGQPRGRARNQGKIRDRYMASQA